MMINCEIISPEKRFVYSKLKSITLPAYSGRMQVLSGHAEAFILLRKGDILLKRGDQENKIVKIDGGECYISPQEVVIVL